LEDVEPTSIGRARRATEVDEHRDTTMAGDEAAPLAIIAESRHAVMRRSAVPVVVAVAIVAALVGALALFMSAGGASVAMPSVVGTQQTDAARATSDAGLLLKVVERRVSDDPKGLVIEQRPAPGTFVRDGDEIEVVVSRGPPPVATPNVAGKPVAEAQAALEQASFVVTVKREYDEDVPKDVALRTDPPADAKWPRESNVTLFVSDGPTPVPVPDVAGGSYDAAVQTLASKRLQAVRRDAFSDTVDAGVVIGTEPAAGQPAARDSQVTVVVSKGPETVQVPNVVGMAVEAASQALSSVGLTPDVQNYGPGKRVRAQDPTGGTVVKKGSKVTLFL
jgi:beta-lactam-binding protein with PASTA domain